MTIAATRTRELDINTIVKRAMQQAGMMEPSGNTSDPLFGPRREMALDMLDTICKDIQTSAVIARHVILQSAAVTSGSNTVTLSTNTMALMGSVAMFKETGQNVEIPVRIVGLDDYMQITDKTASGWPSIGYHARQAAPTITLWPVPDRNGTLTYESHILAADANDATKTLDFEQHWQSFFIWALVHDLSFSSGVALNRCEYAKAMALEKFERAVPYSREQQPVRVMAGHKTPWSR